MSIWKTKAHLQEAKERVMKSSTRSSLVSGPKHHPAISLPPYGRDIPQALQDLSQLLPDVPATEDDGQPEEPSTPPMEEPTSQVENPEMQDPDQVQVDHHQQEAPANDSHVVIRTLDITELVARSTDQPGLHMLPISAKPWPKLAFSLSLTSASLPASEHLHQPSPNQMVTPMQCHSTCWPCNNPTGTSLLTPRHGNWVSTRNSSTGRSFTSPKSRRMPNLLPWYGPSGANGTLQEKS